MSEMEIKRFVRERDGHCCVVCGMTAEQHVARYGRTLDVHRNDPGSVYTVEGCVSVCRACHGPLPRSAHGTGKTLSVEISAKLHTAMVAFVENHRPRVKKKAFLEWAMQEFLEARGALSAPVPS